MVVGGIARDGPAPARLDSDDADGWVVCGHGIHIERRESVPLFLGFCKLKTDEELLRSEGRRCGRLERAGNNLERNELWRAVSLTRG